MAFKAMKLKSLYRSLLVAAVLLTAAAGCKKDPNNPGKEYAPNMYLPVGYEPYKQEKANPINPQGLTMRLPVAGTVARRNYHTSFGSSDSAVVAAEISLAVPSSGAASLSAADSPDSEVGADAAGAAGAPG